MFFCGDRFIGFNGTSASRSLSGVLPVGMLIFGTPVQGGSVQGFQFGELLYL